MKSELTLAVQKREESGKNVNRRVRRDGGIPAVVYGAGREAVSIRIDRTAIYDFFRKGGSETAVFLLRLGDSKQTRHAMIRDLQIDPIKREIIHIDFLRVLMDEKVKVSVPVEVRGEAYGVKNDGGVLDFVNREVEVESLPGDIPSEFIIDVTALHIGQHIEVSDLEVPDNVEILDEPNKVILSISQSRVAATLEEAEAAEGEDDLIEAELAEPELIGRGKDDEDEDEEG